LGLLFRKRIYDRRRILEAAAMARSRNQRHKAIANYRWVLAVERNNPELHARLAPLLAETGQYFDAWQSFRATAQGALREGREERAIEVYREAARLLPQEIQAWQSLARALVKRGDEREAVEALLEGSTRFRSPYVRAHAVHLLRRARTIEPWNFEVVFRLARHLARSGQREESALLLEGLTARVSGRRLRRVRGAQFRLEGSPRAAWRWLRAAFDHDDDVEEDARAVRTVVPLRAARR
jgi:Flp pilus assembly protein TadD